VAVFDLPLSLYSSASYPVAVLLLAWFSVLHPTCVHTVEEFRLYSYKVDRLSGDVLPDIVDKHDHAIDSLRYALAPLIKSGGPRAFLAYLATQAPQQPEPPKQFGAITELT
jgi:hypothetical protein